MAQSSRNGSESEAVTDRKKVTRPVTVAPSQYLFTTDRLLEDADHEGPVRVRNRFQWILTNINFTLGLGPLWRFPTVAYREAGGAYVVAYTLTFILVGYPLALLEVCLGQCTRRRAATVFKLCTALEGLSICMGLYSFLIPIYYNVIFAYAIFYFYHAFATELPWTKCDDAAQFPGYVCFGGRADKNPNVSAVSAQELFWHFRVLGGEAITGRPVFSQLNSPLVLCLTISWLLVGILLVHKIRKYTFAVEYLLIPFIMLVMLLVYILNLGLVGGTRGSTAVRGLQEFFIPSIEIFKNIQIWREATQQVFFSLGVASGPLITLGSLSHFKSPVHVDSAVVCAINFLFSLISGMAIFYAAAALTQDIGRNTGVLQSMNFFGAGVFFIASSKILGELPLPQFWAATFYFLLFCLGSRTVMGSIDTTVSVVRYFIPLGRRRLKVQLAGVIVLISSFLLGLLLVMKGDTLMLVVFDRYGGATALPLLAAIECLGVTWIYGVVRFSGDVEFMLDYKPNMLLRIIWLGIPAYLFILVTASWIHAWVVYPREDISPWSLVLFGWSLVLLILLPLPIRFIVNFVQLYKKKRLKEIFKSRDDSGPDELELWYRDEHFFDRISVLMPP